LNFFQDDVFDNQEAQVKTNLAEIVLQNTKLEMEEKKS